MAEIIPDWPDLKPVKRKPKVVQNVLKILPGNGEISQGLLLHLPTKR